METAEIEGAVGVRGRAVAQFLAGDLSAADETLTSLTNAKKPRADLFFWLGRLRAEQGDAAAAAQAYSSYLEKTKKKAPFRAAAEAAVKGA